MIIKGEGNNSLPFNHNTEYLLCAVHCAVCWATHPSLWDTDNLSRGPAMTEGYIGGNLSMMAGIDWVFTIHQTLFKACGMMEAT